MPKKIRGHFFIHFFETLMRPVKIPDDYSREIATLHRIATILKADERLPVEGRESYVADLHRIIKRLMAFELASIDGAEAAETEVETEAPPESTETDASETAEPATTSSRDAS